MCSSFALFTFPLRKEDAKINAQVMAMVLLLTKKTRMRPTLRMPEQKTSVVSLRSVQAIINAKD